jgi:hypothetical protein
MFRRDYLIRLIEQAGDAMAKALTRRKDGDPVEATRILDAALTDLLEKQASLFVHLDAASAARMLADPLRITAAAQIYLAQASLLTESGDTLGAGIKTTSAKIFYEEARRRGGIKDADLEALK